MGRAAWTETRNYYTHRAFIIYDNDGYNIDRCRRTRRKTWTPSSPLSRASRGWYARTPARARSAPSRSSVLRWSRSGSRSPSKLARYRQSRQPRESRHSRLERRRVENGRPGGAGCGRYAGAPDLDPAPSFNGPRTLQVPRVLRLPRRAWAHGSAKGREVLCGPGPSLSCRCQGSLFTVMSLPSALPTGLT